MRQTERATCLAKLKQLGQKVDTLSRTPSQCSARWALERGRRHAVPAEPEHHLPCVRNAVAKIRRAGPQRLSLGKGLFAFTTREPGFYHEEGRAVIWLPSNEVKVARAKSSTAW